MKNSLIKASHVVAHPNEENKMGKAPYASFTKRNHSTNEQRDFNVLYGKTRFRLKTYLEGTRKYFNKKQL